MTMTLKEITDAVDAGETVCWERDEVTVVRDGGGRLVGSVHGVEFLIADMVIADPTDFYILEDAPAGEVPGELAVVERGRVLVITFAATKDNPKTPALAELWNNVGNHLLAERWVAIHNLFLGIADPVAAVETVKKKLREIIEESDPQHHILTIVRDNQAAQDALAALTPKPTH